MTTADKPKIGVSYNLFDGEELLRASIKSIRNKVDNINIVYQKISYTGNPASENIEEQLNELVKEGLVDELFLYNPILQLKPRINEVLKRNIGFEIAKKNGCDYFLGMDVDEFYDENQFELAFSYIIENDISMSAVSIIEYHKEPEYQIQGLHNVVNNELFNYYVPFLIKIDRLIAQKHAVDYFPCVTDPTRSLSCPGRFRMFSVHEIAMHHMKYIRKDLVKKYKNTSEQEYSAAQQEKIEAIAQSILNYDFNANKQLPENISACGEILVKKVDNKFGIYID